MLLCGPTLNRYYLYFFFFFFNYTATTEIYTLSLYDALPIWRLLRHVVQRLSSASRTYGASRRLKPEPQPPRRRFRRLHRALEMKARPRSQRHKLKQTPWRLHLPYRPARRTPMSPCPSSTLPALSERVTRSLPAGLDRKS